MPRVTRVPGHTPLTPSPLMRRAKPQHVSLAPDALQSISASMSAADATGSFTTPPRAVSPSGNALSPNTRLSRLVHEGTVAIGGAAGGSLAAITTLKSDLVMLQAEIDATTAGTAGGPGALELQSTLSRFGGSNDERVNMETCNTLMALVLMKINELARLHGSRPATAPRQSRVGDIVSLFRGLRTTPPPPTVYAVEQHGGSGAPPGLHVDGAFAGIDHDGRSPTFTSTSAVRTPAAAAAKAAAANAHHHARTASTASDFVEDICWDATAPAGGSGASLPAQRRSISTASATVGGAMPALSPQSPRSSVAQQQRAPSQLPGTAGSSAATPPSGLRSTDPAAATTRGSTAASLPLPAATATATAAAVKRLEKQLELFRYLEKTLHTVDLFDSTLRHCTMNDAMKELGMDMQAMLSAHKVAAPAYTVNKAGVMRPVAPRPVATVTFDGAAVNPAALPDTASPPTAAVDAASGGASAIDADASGISTNLLPPMPETQAVAGLKALVAFQNAIVSLLLAELRGALGLPVRTPAWTPSPRPAGTAPASPKQPPQDAAMAPPSAAKPSVTANVKSSDADAAAVEQLRQRVAALEEALTQRNEQLAAERQLHMLRHERAANVIVAERGRSSTPNFGMFSGGFDVLTRPSTVAAPAATLALAWGPQSADEVNSRPASRLRGDLPPVSRSPILATRPSDVPGATELMYKKALQQQGDIIRDLQSRVATPVQSTRPAAAPL